ncbi:MAG: Holliday junction resolvase RuvX [Acidobacteriia bacterium]|nr:Holliday junction resolvase RuvX [Terriglobia bacterium]
MAHATHTSPGEPHKAPPARRALLAVDYGRARIGLALADMEARIARPLGTLLRKNRNEDMRRLREVIREHGVRQVIVGLPLRLDGTRGAMAEEAARFAERIRKQIGLPVEMVDERLSSWEAEQQREKKIGPRGPESTEKRKKRPEGKDSVDALAAAVILRDYLERSEAAREKH